MSWERSCGGNLNRESVTGESANGSRRNNGGTRQEIIYRAPGMLQELKAEQKKLKGRKAALVPLGFTFFMFLWSFWIVRNPSAEDLACGYSSLLYQYAVMNTILIPTMIAVIASRICDMEIKGDTMKILFTLQKRNHFFDCKFIMGMKYLLLYILGQGAVILAFGRGYGFTEELPLPNFLLHLCGTAAVGAALLLLQQVLSLFFDNQILPMIVGLAGSFLGLFSMFFPEAVTRLVLWAYFVVFCTVKMDWDSTTRITEYYLVKFPTVFFLIFLAVLAAAYIMCRIALQRKEV